jgi:hypothetical protein
MLGARDPLKWYSCGVNIERTIEFIIESQDKTEIRLTGITTLLQQGMRMVVKTDRTLAELAPAQKRTEARVADLAGEMKDLAGEMKELARAQKETQRTLQVFIKGQRNGRNGH